MAGEGKDQQSIGGVGGWMLLDILGIGNPLDSSAPFSIVQRFVNSPSVCQLSLQLPPINNHSLNFSTQLLNRHDVHL